MREIKFRALDRNTGRWHVLTLPKLIKGETSAWCDVDVETIGEYSGSTSKTGEDVYEGDVTACGCLVAMGPFIADGEYGTEAYGWHTTDGRTSWGIDPDMPETIIGNIHQQAPHNSIF